MSFFARRAIAAPSFTRAFSSTTVRPTAKLTVVGNLAAPPELSTTSTGREILKYAVASNSGPRDNPKTSWFRVTAFIDEGPRRDYFQSLPKGTLVWVESDASIGTWEDAEGKRQTTLNLTQRSLEVLRRPRSEEGAAEGAAE